MAVTDYIFQEETVEKRNLGTWLVAKMVAAGWQQVGSNPPTAVTDPGTKFYVMKTKRDSDNAEVYIALNDVYLRTINGTYSSLLHLDLWTDYTPGAAGTNGTTTRGVARAISPLAVPPTTFFPFGYSGAFPLDTLLSVRFCITKTNVTLFTRPPSTTNLAGQMLFFGLPDFLQKEKPASGGLIYSSGSFNAGNDQPLVCDTTLGTPSVSVMYERTAFWLDPQKSPDASGQFPLMPVFVGGTDTGLRHRIPSFFLLRDGGILDRDIIQVNGMNFEIMVSHSSFGSDVGSVRTTAYRIS
jgi:hypothetical protein